MTIGEYLRRYAAKSALRMHMPGHKGKLDAFDITEIAPAGLGEITDAVRDAERIAAARYGAENAAFLTGGSTVGLLAALLALPEGKPFVPKFSHRSVYAGCVLSRREPLVADTQYDEGLPLPVRAETVRAAVRDNPDLIGAVVTSPDYYGRTADIAAIRAALGSERYLIVDAAHGAHFGLRPELPSLPFTEADAVIVSAHKTLPALNQAAIAFCSPRFLSPFRAALSLLVTTSPSYPILASIESGVQAAADTDVKPLIEAAMRIPYRVPSDDPLRIVLDAYAAHSNGAALGRFLSERGVEPEFCDARYAVLIGTCADTVQEYEHIASLLTCVPAAPRTDWTQLPALACAAPFLYDGETEEVNLADAAGRILAGEVGWYPPCAPLGVRGERVSAALVDALRGREVFGIENGKLAVRMK